VGRFSTELWVGRRFGKSIAQREWRERMEREAKAAEIARGAFLWNEPGWMRPRELTAQDLKTLFDAAQNEYIDRHPDSASARNFAINQGLDYTAEHSGGRFALLQGEELSPAL
jgi:hypothetical protein